MIELIAALSKTESGDGYVFVSSSSNNLNSKKVKAMLASGRFESIEENENPLSAETKVHYLQKMYPGTSTRFINTTKCECRQLFKVIHKLREAGYTRLSMVVGSDRVPVFTKMFEKESDLSVVSAGERNLTNLKSNIPKAMSGTKMRIAAVQGNLDFFKRGVMIGSMTEDDALDLMNLVRAGLGYPPFTAGGFRPRIRRQTRRMRRYKLKEDERIT
jgi:hypothetical protein